MMKLLYSFAIAALFMLSANAASMSNGKSYDVTEPEPELIFHTAAPGICITPRCDMSEMVIAYDLTLIPREGYVYFRWGHLNENGEGEGLWTRWRDYDGVFSFTTPGIYVLETFASTLGKDKSPTISVTFKVDYLGSTMAPGIKMIPVGERGYYVTLLSLYEGDIYYRWKHDESSVWAKWRLYTEAIPFTEAGQYVLDVNCDGDVMGAYIVVPRIDYYIPGDVNHNGNVDIEDVTALINMLLNTDFMIATGDVNKDGTIDINDVTELIKMLMTSH